MPNHHACRRTGAVLITAGMLAGCATTRVTNIARTEAGAVAPARIVVDAAYVPVGNAKEDEAGHWAATRIGSDLTRRLRKAGFNAVQIGAAPSDGTNALLSVSVRSTKRGSLLKRTLIGFGAGRATLSASVRFIPSAAASPQLGFDAAAWTQTRPGLVAPIGIGLATRGAVGLIPVAASGTLGLRDGLGRAVVRFDKAVIEQLKRSYDEARWILPKKIAPAPAAG